ncbi:hypothetical protein H9Q73_000424 [Fusarium xylarioides]|nr:hypothetical protein H9Q73_000424 [Fusarium xylarioides]
MSARTMLRYGLARPHVSFRRYISTRDMTAADLKKLKVDQSRLMDTLHDTCKWGTGLRWGENPTDTGMSRLALSDSDKTVRDWFVETTKSLGCKVTIDSIGNIFAIRPGRKDGPPTVAGSHLDTQPTGGRYDGILGIQAGIEMLKILQDHDVETEYPVGVVNWTNEEGARFPISMMASGVWAEAISEERAHNVKEVSGNATVKSELQRIGYLGDTPASYKAMPIGAHFELHIEQGPILERAGKKIGVVQGVQAYKWFTIDVTGRDAHTGSTPFSDRADALLLAARLITHSHRLATKHKALASTGILNLTPGSTNTIPGHVSFTLDIRSPSDETVEKLEEELRRDFDLLAQGTDVDGLLARSTPALPLSLKWRTDTISTATKFHPDCIQAVRESAESILGKDAAVDISSGAGHDSVYTNKHCPTTMIFIPCKGGVSHNPEEYSSPEDLKSFLTDDSPFSHINTCPPFYTIQISPPNLTMCDTTKSSPPPLARIASSRPFPPKGYVSEWYPCTNHAIKDAWNDPQSPLRQQIIEALSDINWISIDVIRSGYAESYEALDDRSICPVTISVHVKVGSTTPEQGQAAVLRCKKVLDEFDFSDVEVNISEARRWGAFCD